MQNVGRFIIYLCTSSHILTSNNSLVAAMKLKANENSRTAALLLFCILPTKYCYLNIQRLIYTEL
jgi:hypothetical protein